MNQGQQCHITNAIDEQSKVSPRSYAPSDQHSCPQLLALSSGSQVITRSNLRASRQSLSWTTLPHHLSHQCMPILETYLPPRARSSSLGKLTLLLLHLLHLRLLALRPHLSPVAVATVSIPQQFHRPLLHRHPLAPPRCRNLLHWQLSPPIQPNPCHRQRLPLLLHRLRTRTLLPWPASLRLPRGVSWGWITTVVIAAHLMLVMNFFYEAMNLETSIDSASHGCLPFLLFDLSRAFGALTSFHFTE